MLPLVLVGLVGGLIAGIGGPGGLPVIAALYAWTDLGTAWLAGTTSTIFMAATVVASLLYHRSRDIDTRLIWPLIVPTIAGTGIGRLLNPVVPRASFGMLVGLLIVAIGVTVVYREGRGLTPRYILEPGGHDARVILAALGLVVGVLGGLFGIGGPAITIPVLVFLGIPALQAIGAGLVQGIVTTTSTSAQYWLGGTVSPELVLVIGVPYIMAQVLGWIGAHRIRTQQLSMLLGGMLVVVGLYLIATPV